MFKYTALMRRDQRRVIISYVPHITLRLVLNAWSLNVSCFFNNGKGHQESKSWHAFFCINGGCCRPGYVH